MDTSLDRNTTSKSASESQHQSFFFVTDGATDNDGDGTVVGSTDIDGEELGIIVGEVEMLGRADGDAVGIKEGSLLIGLLHSPQVRGQFFEVTTLQRFRLSDCTQSQVLTSSLSLNKPGGTVKVPGLFKQLQ